MKSCDLIFLHWFKWFKSLACNFCCCCYVPSITFSFSVSAKIFMYTSKLIHHFIICTAPTFIHEFSTNLSTEKNWHDSFVLEFLLFLIPISFHTLWWEQTKKKQVKIWPCWRCAASKVDRFIWFFLRISNRKIKSENFNSVKFDNVSVKITAAAQYEKKNAIKKSTKNRLLLTNVYLMVHIDKGLRYGIVNYTVTLTPISKVLWTKKNRKKT